MNNIKHKLSLAIIILSCQFFTVNAQSYFFSLGDRKCVTIPIEEAPSTETMCDSIDTTIVELPEEVKEVKTVSLPLNHLKCTSPFGFRRDPFKGTQRMHSGMDLRAWFEDVRAMLPGSVIKTGYSKTCGYFITLNHGICICSYLHLSSIRVNEGDHISAGDIVGVTGDSGLRCTAPHLHVSCRWNDNKGKYFNPMLLLGFVASKLSEKE